MFSQQINENTLIVEREFGDLNLIQLNWKRDIDEWSIGQCLHHLIVSNNKYVPIFKSVAEGRHKSSLWEKINPMSSYTGQQMIKNLGKDVVKKYKSPKIFLPAKSNVNQNIISDFIKHQDELQKLFSVLEDEKYSDQVITSPVAALLTLRVHDVLNLIVVHEQRHILQGMRVKQSESEVRVRNTV